jgi:hypothetical protein
MEDALARAIRPRRVVSLRQQDQQFDRIERRRRRHERHSALRRAHPARRDLHLQLHLSVRVEVEIVAQAWERDRTRIGRMRRIPAD